MNKNTLVFKKIIYLKSVSFFGVPFLKFLTCFSGSIFVSTFWRNNVNHFLSCLICNSIEILSKTMMLWPSLFMNKDTVWRFYWYIFTVNYNVYLWKMDLKEWSTLPFRGFPKKNDRTWLVSYPVFAYRLDCICQKQMILIYFYKYSVSVCKF